MVRSRLTGAMDLGALVAFGIVMLSPALAHAHFTLDAPTCWMSQDSAGAPQKVGPCAAMPDPRGKPGTPTLAVTAYQSGQTISVKVTATIPHPGWYRIALAKGKSATQTLTSLPDPPGTNCSPMKMTNPVWSPTQPVIADGLPTGSQTFQIKLPASVTCDSASPCALQVIMVMTDHSVPDCYYHHCADITIGGADGGVSGRDSGQDAAPTTDASSITGTGGSASGTGGSGLGGAAGETGAGGAETGAGGTATGTGGATSTTTAGTTNTTGSGGAGVAGSSDGATPAGDNGCTCSFRSRSIPSVTGLGSLLLLALAIGRRRSR